MSWIPAIQVQVGAAGVAEGQSPGVLANSYMMIMLA